MSNRIFLKPKEGVKVPMPNAPTTYLPEKGREILLNQYWSRRIVDGDIFVVKQDMPKKSKKDIQKLNSEG